MHGSPAITDPLIQEGFVAAERTLREAMAKPAYPGHFQITVGNEHFGSDATWPGLDGWQMAGAYLLLGEKQVALDYFRFVRESQRSNGDVPIAIVSADSTPDLMESYLRGLRYPQDIYEFLGRKWIGLFHHWQERVNPLSSLGATSFILTADEIAANDPPPDWLNENIGAIELAGKYLLSRKSDNGLIAGAGFYIECPPRDQWDGVTQCYVIKAFRILARLCGGEWQARANELSKTFLETFWRRDHFAEYVHPQRGLIDLRRLSDVNLAAIALDVATDEQAKIVWPQIASEKSLWLGGMPTQNVAPPSEYEAWELNEPLPYKPTNGPLHDIAAMGRVWYLDELASRRMGDWERVIESVRLVCEMGQRNGWSYHERYHAQANGEVVPAGPVGYCEYPAILVRIVLSTAPARFMS